MEFYHYWETLEEWKTLENFRIKGRFPLIQFDTRFIGDSFLKMLRPIDEPRDARVWQYLHRDCFERYCPEYLRHEYLRHERDGRKVLTIDLPVSRCGLRIFRDWYYENKLPVFKRGHLYRLDSEAAAFEAYVCGRMLRVEGLFVRDVFRGIFEMYVELENFRPDPSHLLRAINHLSPSKEIVEGVLDLFAQMDPVAFWVESRDCVPQSFWDEAYERLAGQEPQPEVLNVPEQQGPQPEATNVPEQQEPDVGAADLVFRPA